MLLGNDFESSALGFRLDHEPGGFYNVSPANTQLAAVIVERATRQCPTRRFVDERLWRRGRARRRAELQLDRRSGMPAAHCCWRATARDMLRIAEPAGAPMAASRDARSLPAGWVRGDGAALARERRNRHAARALDARRRWRCSSAADDDGSAFWVIPRARARHRQHREPRGRRGAGTAGAVAGRPARRQRESGLSGASFGSRDRAHRPRTMARMDDSFLDSREFARMTRAIEFIEREYQRQPKLAEIARHVGPVRISISTGCSGAGPGSRPSSTWPKSPAARRAPRCATSLGHGRRPLCRTFGRRAVT